LAQQFEERLEGQGSQHTGHSATVCTPLELALEVVRQQQPAQLLSESQCEQLIHELLRGEFGDRLPADHSTLQRLVQSTHPAFPPGWSKEVIDQVGQVRARLRQQMVRTGSFTQGFLLEVFQETVAQGRAPVWDHVFADYFQELPPLFLASLPGLAKVGLTLAGDLRQLPGPDADVEGGVGPADVFSPERLPHIPPLRVIEFSIVPSPPVPALQIIRDSRPLLDHVLRLLEDQVARQSTPASALVVVEDVKTRQSLAPGIDRWVDDVNALHGVSSVGEEQGPSQEPRGVQVTLATWPQAQGLEADVVLLVLTSPPRTTPLGPRMLYVGLARARRRATILLTGNAAESWLEECRKQGITYREVGNCTFREVLS
jgi:hypothetical protein